uniref:Pannexin n=1 Tax=Salarias fasciatus TaxID=181472 RepID=A0A672JDP5_SALFA
MEIAHVATEYVFPDFLLRDPTETNVTGLIIQLYMSFWRQLLPLFLISLAFAQEVSFGTQISCFAPTNFSGKQAAYVDSFCWAAVEQQANSSPLWLHKFFPYILLLLAILLYIPALFWRFTAAPHLSSNLKFIMEELDGFFNRFIKRATNQKVLNSRETSEDTQRSALTESCFKYPLVERYLKTKRLSHRLVVKYLTCRVLTLLSLLLACIYLGYYVGLASVTDEFPCDLQTGVLRNDSAVPSAVQCKLVAVGIFRLLSFINPAVYVLLILLVVYAALGRARQSSGFLQPYKILPGFGALVTPFYNDLSIYLLFLQENLSQLKSFKCLKVDLNMLEALLTLSYIKLSSGDNTA